MERALVLMKALSDETRYKIFLILSKQRICVKGLAKICSISEPAVSQHMKVLKNAGLIVGERRGHFMHYKVEKDAVKELVDMLQTVIDGAPRESSMIDRKEVEAMCEKMCQSKEGGCLQNS